MRALLDILNDEKRLVEELNAIDHAIRSTVILFDETYALPNEGEIKETALQKLRNELNMLREQDEYIKSILKDIRTELRDYFTELNK